MDTLCVCVCIKHIYRQQKGIGKSRLAKHRQAAFTHCAVLGAALGYSLHILHSTRATQKYSVHVCVYVCVCVCVCVRAFVCWEGRRVEDEFFLLFCAKPRVDGTPLFPSYPLLFLLLLLSLPLSILLTISSAPLIGAPAVCVCVCVCVCCFPLAFKGLTLVPGSGRFSTIEQPASVA